jgi:hypothetical protein
MPVLVLLSSAAALFAMPRSMIFTRSMPSSSRAIMMFSGLTSRCTMPARCTASSPISACDAMRAAYCGESGPR